MTGERSGENAVAEGERLQVRPGEWVAVPSCQGQHGRAHVEPDDSPPWRTRSRSLGTFTPTCSSRWTFPARARRRHLGFRGRRPLGRRSSSFSTSLSALTEGYLGWQQLRDAEDEPYEWVSWGAEVGGSPGCGRCLATWIGPSRGQPLRCWRGPMTPTSAPWRPFVQRRVRPTRRPLQRLALRSGRAPAAGPRHDAFAQRRAEPARPVRHRRGRSALRGPPGRAGVGRRALFGVHDRPGE